MLVRIPGLLTPDETRRLRERLEAAEWVDGNVTSGEMAATAKRNLQVPETHPVARELGATVMGALNRSPAFVSAVLPSRVFPPLFNRYDAGMGFGAHVDNAIRIAEGGGRIRTDVSSTLFLTPPEDYDGGELVIEDTYGEQRVKFGAGDLVIYPATSLHRVEPITRGSRWASFFWTQSMVRDDGARRLLYELDGAVQDLRARLPDDTAALVRLTGVYHNLLRRWTEL